MTETAVSPETYYRAAPCPAGVRQARIEALDAKIAAVRDLRTDAAMHPWAGDATHPTTVTTTAAPPAPTAGSTP